jgi:lysozyme
VHRGLVWTKEQADAALVADLERFERGVMAMVNVPLTQGQFDALVSFAYNVGLDDDADTFAEGLGDSTLLRKVNAEDFAGAADEFPKWNKNDGKVMLGLKRRRAAEKALFEGMNGDQAIAVGAAAT